MTVFELIQKLSTFQADTEVRFHCHVDKGCVKELAEYDESIDDYFHVEDVHADEMIDLTDGEYKQSADIELHY